MRVAGSGIHLSRALISFVPLSIQPIHTCIITNAAVLFLHRDQRKPFQAFIDPGELMQEVRSLVVGGVPSVQPSAVLHFPTSISPLNDFLPPIYHHAPFFFKPFIFSTARLSHSLGHRCYILPPTPSLFVSVAYFNNPLRRCSPLTVVPFGVIG